MKKKNEGGKLLQGLIHRLLDLPEFQGRVEAASITGVVGFVVAVKRSMELSFVVVADYHREVEVCLVAVIETTPEVVAMQVFRVSAELQVVVLELQTAKTEHHTLQNTIRTCEQHEIQS